jgi:hypothetical protein
VRNIRYIVMCPFKPIERHWKWGEPLQLDNGLDSLRPWIAIGAEDEAMIQPRVQDVFSC